MFMRLLKATVILRQAIECTSPVMGKEADSAGITGEDNCTVLEEHRHTLCRDVNKGTDCFRETDSHC